MARRPLPGHEGPLDVLAASHKGVRCRFYFDPDMGRLSALEMFPDDESDPCEVYFSDYRDVAGHSWPGRMEVRYGDELFVVFEVKEAGLEIGNGAKCATFQPSEVTGPV